MSPPQPARCRRLARSAAVGALLFAAWSLPRLDALLANVRFLDDVARHFIERDTATIASIWLRNYRPAGFAHHWLLDTLWPGSFETAAPKVLAGLYLSLAGLVLFHLLRRWGAPAWIALVAPLLLVVHPVVNELTLWNICAVLGLAVALFVGGVALLGDLSSRARIAAGWLALLAATLAYPIYFPIAAMLILAEPLVRTMTGSPAHLRTAAWKLALLASVAVLYVAYVAVSMQFPDLTGVRGSFEIPGGPSGYLDRKWHAVFDLTVNVYMPVLAYHVGMESAMPGWKWVAVALAGAVLALAAARGGAPLRSAAIAAAPPGLHALAAAPFLLISAHPESWRISVVTLFAAMLSLTVLLLLLCPARRSAAPAHWTPGAVAGAGLAVAVIAVTLPVSAYEARQRSEVNALDRELLAGIERYWSGRSVPRGGFRVAVVSHRPAYVPGDPDWDPRLTRAYQAYMPPTNLGEPWSWPAYLALHGLGAYTPADGAREDLSGAAARCLAATAPGQRLTGWKVAHDADRRISVVCR